MSHPRRGRQRPHHHHRRRHPRPKRRLHHPRHPRQRRRRHHQLLRVGPGPHGLFLDRGRSQPAPRSHHDRQLQRRPPVLHRPQRQQPHRGLHAGRRPRSPHHQTTRHLRVKREVGSRHYKRLRQPPKPFP